MRKLIYFLIIIAVSTGVYVLWSKSGESVLTPAAGAPGSAAAGETRRFFVSSGDALNQAKDWLFSIPQAAQDKAAEAVDNLQTDIRQKAAEVLLPPPPASSSLPESSDNQQVNPAASGNQVPSSTSQVDVCLSGSKDRSIGYLIENPYSPQAGFAYKVDWGDGETYSASVQPADKSVSVSHTYAASGVYVASFEFQTDSGPVVIARKTCVQ